MEDAEIRGDFTGNGQNPEASWETAGSVGIDHVVSEFTEQNGVHMRRGYGGKGGGRWVKKPSRHGSRKRQPGTGDGPHYWPNHNNQGGTRNGTNPNSGRGRGRGRGR